MSYLPILRNFKIFNFFCVFLLSFQWIWEREVKYFLDPVCWIGAPLNFLFTGRHWYWKGKYASAFATPPQIITWWGSIYSCGWNPVLNLEYPFHVFDLITYLELRYYLKSMELQKILYWPHVSLSYVLGIGTHFIIRRSSVSTTSELSGNKVQFLAGTLNTTHEFFGF